MKILNYFLLLALLFAGCKKHENNEIIVRGQLKGIDVEEISLTSDDLTFKAPVDSTGTFVIKFVNNQARTYKLEFNNRLNLFLIPGDSVIIVKDGEDYKFSGGQSAVLCNYYLEWEKYWSKLTESFDEKKYYSQEPNDFAKTIYKYIDTSKVPLNELSKKLANIDPEFLRLENERLKYWMIIDFFPYEFENHKKYTGKEPVITESFHNYMKEVNLNDSSLMQLDYYKDFLTSYVNAISAKQYRSDTNFVKDKYSETNFILNFIFNKFQNQRIIDHIVYNVMDHRSYDLQVDDKAMTAFKEHCKNKDFVEDIEKKYNESKTLMQGMPAPDFLLYDANKKEYKLSDFKGKYLLIDVWGAFCGPCIREVPFLKQIEKDYRGKNIVFLCLCFEDNSDIWLKKVKDLDLKGIQLIAKGAWHSQFRKDYQIDWVPTYILIDKEGKFLDARAPKPSENLRDLLNVNCK